MDHSCTISSWVSISTLAHTLAVQSTSRLSKVRSTLRQQLVTTCDTTVVVSCEQIAYTFFGCLSPRPYRVHTATTAGDIGRREHWRDPGGGWRIISRRLASILESLIPERASDSKTRCESWVNGRNVPLFCLFSWFCDSEDDVEATWERCGVVRGYYGVKNKGRIPTYAKNWKKGMSPPTQISADFSQNNSMNSRSLWPQFRIWPWSIILGGHVIAQVTWTKRDALRLAKRTGQKINRVALRCVAFRCGAVRSDTTTCNYMRRDWACSIAATAYDATDIDWIAASCRSVHVAATACDKPSFLVAW